MIDELLELVDPWMGTGVVGEAGTAAASVPVGGGPLRFRRSPNPPWVPLASTTDAAAPELIATVWEAIPDDGLPRFDERMPASS